MVPAPIFVTASEIEVIEKVAVTERACVMETVQVVAVPLQAPDHPEKVEPVLGVAESVTEAPTTYGALQLAPQLIPDGLEVTTPVPVPDLATVKVNAGANVAEIVVSDISEMAHVGEELHGLPHPVKTEPSKAAAVKVTVKPLANLPEHDTPQSSPAGADVTFPAPLPSRVTARARAAPTPPTHVPPEGSDHFPGASAVATLTKYRSTTEPSMRAGHVRTASPAVEVTPTEIGEGLPRPTEFAASTSK